MFAINILFVHIAEVILAPPAPPPGRTSFVKVPYLASRQTRTRLLPARPCPPSPLSISLAMRNGGAVSGSCPDFDAASCGMDWGRKFVAVSEWKSSSSALQCLSDFVTNRLTDSLLFFNYFACSHWPLPVTIFVIFCVYMFLVSWQSQNPIMPVQQMLDIGPFLSECGSSREMAL